MLTIQIHDEQLAQKLQQISERENRPVEDVIKTLVAKYLAEVALNAPEAPAELARPTPFRS